MGSCVWTFRRPSDAKPARNQPSRASCPAVRQTLEAIDRGGYLDAVARVGALMASQRGEFPLHHLEQTSDLIRSDAVLSKLTADEARRVRAEQSTVVALEPERALETLPKLVASDRDRDRLLDLLERAAAMVELNQDQETMLDRIRRVLTPVGAAMRGNGRHRLRRQTLSASSPS